LDKNDIRQNEKDKTCVAIKCLNGLIWNWIFRGGTLFSWNGNFLRLPQGVFDIPGTWLLLRWNICFMQCYGSRISARYKNNTTPKCFTHSPKKTIMQKPKCTKSGTKIRFEHPLSGHTVTPLTLAILILAQPHYNGYLSRGQMA